jgi:hypothetical protein
LLTAARLLGTYPRTAEPAVTTIARLNEVNALPVDVRAAAIVALQAFTVFTKHSNPYHEHEFGSFAVVSETFFCKIDCDDEPCTYGSEDPCDPDKTTRVLTLMLAQDYWAPVSRSYFLSSA